MKSIDQSTGFTLLELLLVLLLGSSLTLVCFNVIFRDGELVGNMTKAARRTQERELVMTLIGNDLAQGKQVLNRLPKGNNSCRRKKRRPVLVVETENQQITYAPGPTRSKIWTGQVLWRCTLPLQSTTSSKAKKRTRKKAQWRVVIDRLGETATTWTCPSANGVELLDSADLPFSACIEPQTGLVMMRLSQGGQETIGSGVVGLDRELAF